MSALEKPLVPLLNSLIEVCKRGQEFFFKAGDAIEDPALQSLLKDFSRERLQYCLELQEIVRKTAEDPEERNSAINTVYRGWSEQREKFPHDRNAVLTVCEHEEDLAVTEYHDALQSEHLAEDLRAILERHHRGILETRERILALRGG